MNQEINKECEINGLCKHCPYRNSDCPQCHTPKDSEKPKCRACGTIHTFYTQAGGVCPLFDTPKDLSQDIKQAHQDLKEGKVKTLEEVEKKCEKRDDCLRAKGHTGYCNIHINEDMQLKNLFKNKKEARGDEKRNNNRRKVSLRFMVWLESCPRRSNQPT